ncbi:hypothetical protein JCM10212_000842 [Sporobolomyces blumeae]
MSSGRSLSPEPATRRTTTERRAALNRLKESDASSRRARKQPTFLGADDDDEGGANPFDFDAADNLFGGNKRARDGASTQRDRGSQPGGAGDSLAKDSVLGGAFDDLFDLGGLGEAGGDVLDDALKGSLEDAAAPAKKRRVVAKMDETRLLGSSGFPRLQEDIKRLKLKGKGHEVQDLKRVMSMYQLWTHQMYPKTNLRDTLQTVEKLCHKRSLQSALKQYKNEAKHAQANAASANDPVFGEDGEDDIFAQFGDLLPESKTQERRGEAVTKGEPEANGAGPSARGGSPTEDLDYDALLADEDALMAELEANSKQTGATSTTSELAVATAKRTPVFDDEEDEDDEAMAAMREAEALLA